jgi:hypothetical protein
MAKSKTRKVKRPAASSRAKASGKKRLKSRAKTLIKAKRSNKKKPTRVDSKKAAARRRPSSTVKGSRVFRGATSGRGLSFAATDPPPVSDPSHPKTPNVRILSASLAATTQAAFEDAGSGDPTPDPDPSHPKTPN